jgi:hypothetical protein
MADLLARALTDGALLGSLRDLEARRMDDLDAASFLDKTMALYREA